MTSFTGASICLAGTCTSTVAQDWLIFTVTLNAGSNPVDQIGVSVAGVTTLVGTGYFVDLGETPNGGGSSVSTTQALIGYDWPNISAGNLQALETTDRLFAAFSPVGSLPGPGIPPPIPPGTASFVISRASGADFSVTRTIVVIPEPGTLLLLGGGFLGLGLAGRRRI